MVQNALGQSDYRIFMLILYPEHKDEKTWFFACWYRIMEIKCLLENIVVGVAENGWDHLGLRTLKLAVSQKGIIGISLFLVCW